MDNGQNRIFRKKSLEKNENPDNIKAFVRVINPGIWAILIAVLISLAGIFVWSFSGRINSSFEVAVRADGRETTAFVPEYRIDGIKEGTGIMIDGEKGTVTGISGEPVKAADVMDEYLMHLNGFYYDTWVYILKTDIVCETGIHKAAIITGSVSPISFIMSK